MALYLTEEEVAGLLDMPSVLAAVEAVMAAHARGEVVDYPRQRVRLPTSITHMLQGAVPDKRLTGFKVYTSSGGRARFWVHVFDSDTGEPVAVLEADTLGMMRTGAAGGAGTHHAQRIGFQHGDGLARIAIEDVHPEARPSPRGGIDFESGEPLVGHGALQHVRDRGGKTHPLARVIHHLATGMRRHHRLDGGEHRRHVEQPGDFFFREIQGHDCLLGVRNGIRAGSSIAYPSRTGCA